MSFSVAYTFTYNRRNIKSYKFVGVVSHKFCQLFLFVRTFSISRKDKIRNTIIKQKMNVTRSHLDDIKTKQLQWYGHFQRMEERRLPKEVMKWRPQGRRKGGRPKLTWAEGIRGLMGEKGLMEEDWNDRGNWRKKIL